MSETFYVTTPIYYINDVPSVGSSYPTIAADVLARWHRLRGNDVFYLTGLDENSQKTVQAAAKAGYKDIQKYADEMSLKWLATWKNLKISNDGFIRTTEQRHKKFVHEIFMKVYKKGDIYKGKYEGMYCEGCEAFLTENDLAEGCCPLHKTPAKPLSEENYFFKLSKYQDALLVYIEKHPEFVEPQNRRNEILSIIKQGLKDISISRPNKGWGIPLPIDETQCFWVWFDALSNYISGVPEKYWPADVHIVGKDIQRFHCIIWPAMLLSAGYALPRKVFSHGFFTVNGQKMSKSLGNAIDPNYLASKYGLDALRYYIMREISFGEDGDFSEASLKNRLNTELADILGNLLNRTIVLIEKNYAGKIPGAKTDPVLEKELKIEKINLHMEKIELHSALAEIFSFIASCNRYVNEKEPWKLKGKELESVLYSLADSLRIISILLSAYLPDTSEKINVQLGVKAGTLAECKFNHLKSGTKVQKGGILFRKIE